MKVNKMLGLQRHLSNEFLLIGILAGVIFLVNWYFEYQGKDLVERKNRIEGEVRELSTQLNDLQSKAQEIQEAAKLWRSLNEGELVNTGLRIDEARETIENLEKKYDIAPGLKINLTPPKDLDKIDPKQTSVISESNVDMSFVSYSDLNILNFVNALNAELSGFIRITNFRMTRTGQANDEVLLKLRQGEIPANVTADMQFIWRDLKDVSDAKKGQER